MSNDSATITPMSSSPAARVGEKRKRVRGYRGNHFSFNHMGPFKRCVCGLCSKCNGEGMKVFDMQEVLDHFLMFYNMNIGNNGKCRIQGEEGGKGKRAHLQGALSSKRQLTLKTLQGLLPGWSVEPSRDIKASFVYVFKNETARRDWPSLTKGIHEQLKLPIRDPLAGCDLYGFQRAIIAECAVPCTNERMISWIYEEEGNTGKTALCKHLRLKNPQSVCYISVGKGTDLCHHIVTFIKDEDNDLKVVLMDIPRCTDGHVSYATIEQIKNGILFSGKYESCSVEFNSPHIFVFSNQMPDLSKMSRDRWNIIRAVKQIQVPAGGVPLTPRTPTSTNESSTNTVPGLTSHLVPSRSQMMNPTGNPIFAPVEAGMKWSRLGITTQLPSSVDTTQIKVKSMHGKCNESVDTGPQRQLDVTNSQKVLQGVKPFISESMRVGQLLTLQKEFDAYDKFFD